MWPYFGYSPMEISAAWLRGSNVVVNWPQFVDRKVILTHFSRVGIVLAYRLLGLSPGDEVLVPAYNCGSELDPLLWCGAKVVFYRVDSHAMIDIEDIQSRVTLKTRAVYVTHYFGWSHRLAELYSWCKERDLLLIEDCALSLFSDGPEGPVGCSGDAAIHCFWKSLPVPDGGALCLPKTDQEISVEMKNPDFSAIILKTQPFLNNWLRNTCRRYLGLYYNMLKGRFKKKKGDNKLWIQDENRSSFPKIPPSYYFDEKIKDWHVSRISKGVMKGADPQKVVQFRRRNYNQLYGEIRDLRGIKTLFDDLPEGVCPLVLPIVVEDPHHWQRSLNKLQLHYYAWWSHYHPKLSWEGFPESIKLKGHLLTFPIHQHLNEKHIHYIADCIKAVSLEK